MKLPMDDQGSLLDALFEAALRCAWGSKQRAWVTEMCTRQGLRIVGAMPWRDALPFRDLLDRLRAADLIVKSAPSLALDFTGNDPRITGYVHWIAGQGPTIEEAKDATADG